MFDHIRSLHVDTSEISKCDLCPFETMYKCNLVNHIKNMHNLETEAANALYNQQQTQTQLSSHHPLSTTNVNDNSISDIV